METIWFQVIGILYIIPGIIAGILNKKMKWALLSGLGGGTISRIVVINVIWILPYSNLTDYFFNMHVQYMLITMLPGACFCSTIGALIGNLIKWYGNEEKIEDEPKPEEFKQNNIIHEEFLKGKKSSDTISNFKKLEELED